MFIVWSWEGMNTVQPAKVQNDTNAQELPKDICGDPRHDLLSMD